VGVERAAQVVPIRVTAGVMGVLALLVAPAGQVGIGGMGVRALWPRLLRVLRGLAVGAEVEALKLWVLVLVGWLCWGKGQMALALGLMGLPRGVVVHAGKVGLPALLRPATPGALQRLILGTMGVTGAAMVGAQVAGEPPATPPVLPHRVQSVWSGPALHVHSQQPV